MRAPIAKIRINAGNPGWYDPLTNIHLTITRPEAYVYEGSNTTNIKRSVSHGLVYILEGSLEEEKDQLTESIKAEKLTDSALVAGIVSDIMTAHNIGIKDDDLKTALDDVIITEEEQESLDAEAESAAAASESAASESAASSEESSESTESSESSEAASSEASSSAE